MPKQLELPRGTKVPDHISIILDGNRRWARARGLKASEGHKAGYRAMQEVVRTSRQLGVHTLTVWGFSTENWERPTKEIENIMKLVRVFIQDFKKEAKREGVRFVHVGRKDRLPKDILRWFEALEQETKDYKKHILNVALDYGGRDEIIRATRKIVASGVVSEKIDEKLFESYLDTAGQPYPYPDLFIRTSGEQRTSGLLPWQMTYAEIYWETDHLPDFTPEKLRDAILDYSRRRRRFGGNDAEEHLRFKPEVAARFEVSWWRLGKIPAGTPFSDYAVKHLKEQFGMSGKLATEAARLMLEAFFEGKGEKWDKSARKLKRFYKLVRDEVKLAFEPKVLASLEVKLWQKSKDGNASVGDMEDISREYLAEMYRISDFQASKAAHLKVLANLERESAVRGMGEHHWDKAEDYLQKYYRALKDRVA